jgi:branched-subunit amino acid transport protein
MAQAVSRRSLTVVDKVALGQAFLQVFQFSPVSIIPMLLSIVIYHRGDEQ